MLMGMVFGGLGFAIYGLAPTGGAFLIGTPVFGLIGFFGPGFQGLVTRRAGPDEQGRLQGANSSLAGLAGVAAPTIFGFTYAYRWNPKSDAAFFSYLGHHGGRRFRRALGFVGLDFYPGTFYPPTMQPGQTYRSELAQAAGVLRDCYLPKARIRRSVPIWITENGIPTKGKSSQGQQASALRQLVEAVSAYSGTFHITDYRWFNLRDSSSSSPAVLIGPTFSSDGLLRSDYTPKVSFGTYRRLIAALGARATKTPRPGRARGCGSDRRRAAAVRAARRMPCARSSSPTRPSSRRPARESPARDRR